MNIDTMSYVLVSTLIGVPLVFFFLAFLAVVMVILGKIDNAKKAPAAAPAPAAAAAAPAAAESAAENNDWIIAAVAAYIEEDEEPVSALAWTPSENLKYDSWASAPRVTKRFSGVNR